MKLELKKLKLYPALSEETQAYSAEVHLDGKLIAHATNDGHGASDNFTPHAPFTHDDLLALEKRIAAEYPPIKSSITGEDLPYDLELVCGDLIHRAQTEKRLARAMKSKIVIIAGSDLREFSYRGIKILTPEFYAKAKPHVLAKYPSATILNDMPLSAAVDAVVALPTNQAKAPTMTTQPNTRTAWALGVDTLCGRWEIAHLEQDGKEYADLYHTEREAELELADDIMTRLRDFIDGTAGFDHIDEAIDIGHQAIEVTVRSDGAVLLNGVNKGTAEPSLLTRLFSQPVTQ